MDSNWAVVNNDDNIDNDNIDNILERGFTHLWVVFRGDPTS